MAGTLHYLQLGNLILQKDTPFQISIKFHLSALRIVHFRCASIRKKSVEHTVQRPCASENTRRRAAADHFVPERGDCLVGTGLTFPRLTLQQKSLAIYDDGDKAVVSGYNAPDVADIIERQCKPPSLGKPAPS